MDTLAAFAMGQANRGQPMMVFDWDEAARRMLAHSASNASAGLAQDWEWTGGEILADGEPVPNSETYTYLASTWACPELDLGNGPEPCWRYAADTDSWDAGTYWPESALAILRKRVPAADETDRP